MVLFDCAIYLIDLRQVSRLALVCFICSRLFLYSLHIILLFRVITRGKINKNPVLPVFCGIERPFGSSCTPVVWPPLHCDIIVSQNFLWTPFFPNRSYCLQQNRTYKMFAVIYKKSTEFQRGRQVDETVLYDLQKESLENIVQ